MALANVQAVAHHELVGDLEADEVGVYGVDLPALLTQEHRNLDRQRPLLAQMLGAAVVQDLQGTIAALQKIVDMIVPVYGQEGGTMVIPGHGRLCDFGDVLNFREMTIIIRDRVQDMIKKGMTLEQVKAAGPTQDYDPLYGSGDKFVEAVYKSLKGQK